MKVEIAHLPCIKAHFDYVAPSYGLVIVIKRNHIDSETGINMGSTIYEQSDIWEGDIVSEVIGSGGWADNSVVLFLPFRLSVSAGVEKLAPMFAAD